MKQVTNEMIKEFQMKKLKYDFMGYYFRNRNELSFHHLILSRKICNELQLSSQGYWRCNGAILNQETSHEYLHAIENYDPEIFYLITAELIDENIKGKIDIENLKQIRQLLLYFESQHRYDKNHDHHPVIKEKYLVNRIIL